MVRWIIGSWIAALVLSLGVSGAEAAKGTKKKPTEKRVTGEIQAVNSDATVLTVSASKGKAGKPKADKGQAAAKPKGKGKKAGATQEIRIGAGTVVEYVGIDNQDDKKLQRGYYVTAILAEDGTAKAISVSKSPIAAESAKKPKKKKNA